MALFQKKIEKINTSTVFKNSGIPEYTFVDRGFIQRSLKEAVELRSKAIFFLGYSKSGKTVYRKKFFDSEKNHQCITYRRNKNSNIQELYDYIAKEASLSKSKSVSYSESKQIKSTNEAKLENPVVGGVSSSTGQESYKNKTSNSFMDESRVDINFLCSGLSNSNFVIFLEDYHLVDEKINQQFSEDLKHFLDEGVLFVVIGIPGSPGRSFQYNPDLTGRSISLNFDFLKESEALDIISKGESTLNVKISDPIKAKILQYSYRNAYLIQSICCELMNICEILETQEKTKTIDDTSLIKQACKNVAKNLKTDYKSILDVIIKGARQQKEGKAFNQYEEIVRVLKSAKVNEIESGLNHTYIAKRTFDRFSEETVQSIVETHNYKSVRSFKGSIQS